MHRIYPFAVILLVLLIAGRTAGEVVVIPDFHIEPPPPLLNPPAPSEVQKNHYQALKLFLKARRCEADSHMLDAVRAYEEALKLEPKAAPILRALVPLCFSLDRDEQALDYCKRALALHSDDYELLCIYAREMQERDRLSDAASALAKAVQLPEAKHHPEQLAQMCFGLATMYEELKQHDKAARAYEKVVEILEKPDALEDDSPLGRRQIAAEVVRTYERLGRAELQAKQYDKAIAAFKKAQEKGQADRIPYLLAEVYLAKNQPEQALEKLQEYVNTQPPGAEAYAKIVEVLTTLKRQQEIVPTLEAAVARDAFNQSLKLLLAKYYAEAGQTRKAEDLHLAVWKESPSEDCYQGLARLLQQQNRWSELLQMLNQSLSGSHASGAARPQLQVLTQDAAIVRGLSLAALSRGNTGEPLDFKTKRALATLCRQTRQYELAEKMCRLCLTGDPNPGEVYVELCRVLSEARKYEALAEACREALAKKVQAPEQVFQLELARALALAGKETEAVASAQQAIQQTQPATEERFRAHYALAVVYYRCAQFDKALRECEKLLEEAHEAKQQRQVHYLMSGIYSTRHDYERAEDQLQKLLAIDPEDATANNDLGYIWADQGKKLEEAEKLIRKAIELDRLTRSQRRTSGGPLENSSAESDNAAYIDSLGWVLFKRGQVEEACRNLERATKLADGDDPVIWDHLGDVYLTLKRLSMARTAWQRALDLYETTNRLGLEDRHNELVKKLGNLEQTTTKTEPDP